METLIFIGVLVLIVISVISAGVKVVPQSETRVIERLGKYHSTLPAGLNVIIPFIDRAKTIYTRTMERMPNGRYVARLSSTKVIDLREQVYDFPSQQVITKDNVTTEINALLYFQIVDAKKSVYEFDNLPNAIEKLTQTSLRNVIGELELDETLTSRDTINSKLQSILDDATNKWGVKVNRVELQDITPPESVREAMRNRCRPSATVAPKSLMPRVRRNRLYCVRRARKNRASTQQRQSSSRKYSVPRVSRVPRCCRQRQRLKPSSASHRPYHQQRPTRPHISLQ